MWVTLMGLRGLKPGPNSSLSSLLTISCYHRLCGSKPSLLHHDGLCLFHDPRAIINPSCLNSFGQRFGHSDIKVIDTGGIGPDCVQPTEAAWHAEVLARAPCLARAPRIAGAPRIGLWELATLLPLRHTFPICKSMDTRALARTRVW